jgi:hypothetical protein
MKTFLAVYLANPIAMSKWNELPEEVRVERQAVGIKAWYDWVDRNKERIIEIGGPLGKTKSVSSAGITDIRNNMTAYTIVRAETHGEAAKMFEGHPHYTVFPGESVEIMECLPIPSN